jgi:hypothetical protein
MAQPIEGYFTRCHAVPSGCAGGVRLEVILRWPVFETMLESSEGKESVSFSAVGGRAATSMRVLRQCTC